jgi:hypothetical protein
MFMEGFSFLITYVCYSYNDAKYLKRELRIMKEKLSFIIIIITNEFVINQTVH